MFTRALISHFLVRLESEWSGGPPTPDNILQASATAILTFSRSFFHSALAPRILAAEVDHPEPKYDDGESDDDNVEQQPFLLSDELRSLLFAAETVQFSRALSVGYFNWERFAELLCDSQYLSRSLVRLRVRTCMSSEFDLWDVIPYKAGGNRCRCAHNCCSHIENDVVKQEQDEEEEEEEYFDTDGPHFRIFPDSAKMVNLEEIETNDLSIWRLFSLAAGEGFRIHLKKLKLVFDFDGDKYLTSYLSNPEKLFSQQGTGWGKTLQVLHLSEFDVSDEAFEAFQYCTNLREIDIDSPSQHYSTFSGKAFDLVFGQARFVSIIRLSNCEQLSDVSGIRHLEYLNELSFTKCKFSSRGRDGDDSTGGMSAWNGERMFPYLEKFTIDHSVLPDPENSLAFLEQAVPSLVDIKILLVTPFSLSTTESNKVYSIRLQSSCCECLKSIHIAGGWRAPRCSFNEERMAGILRSTKRLESLKLQHVTGFSSLETMFSEVVVAALAPTLTVLSLNCLSVVSVNKGALEKLSKMKLLEECDLCGLHFDKSCSDALLDLPNLRKFKASSLDRKAKWLSSINFLRPCSNLVELSLQEATDLSDISVFASDLRKLRSIELSGCCALEPDLSLEPFCNRKQQQQQQQQRLPERRNREQEQKHQRREDPPFAPLQHLNISILFRGSEIFWLRGVSIQELEFHSFDGEAEMRSDKMVERELECVLETISLIPDLKTIKWFNDVSRLYRVFKLRVRNGLPSIRVT